MSKSKMLFEEASESLNRYERRAEAYEEQWNKDHDKAMRCLAFEELLAFGLSIYQFINHIDEAWRRKVHQGLMEYDPAVKNAITSLFKSWLRCCKRVEKRLTALEK